MHTLAAEGLSDGSFDCVGRENLAALSHPRQTVSARGEFEVSNKQTKSIQQHIIMLDFPLMKSIGNGVDFPALFNARF